MAYRQCRRMRQSPHRPVTLTWPFPPRQPIGQTCTAYRYSQLSTAAIPAVPRGFSGHPSRMRSRVGEETGIGSCLRTTSGPDGRPSTPKNAPIPNRPVSACPVRCWRVCWDLRKSQEHDHNVQRKEPEQPTGSNIVRRTRMLKTLLDAGHDNSHAPLVPADSRPPGEAITAGR
jgi:hypothetical protein